MRNYCTGIVVTACVAFIGTWLLSLPSGVASVNAQESHEVTAEMVDRWMRELSNWGRWGDGPQLLLLPDGWRGPLFHWV